MSAALDDLDAAAALRLARARKALDLIARYLLEQHENGRP